MSGNCHSRQLPLIPKYYLAVFRFGAIDQNANNHCYTYPLNSTLKQHEHDDRHGNIANKNRKSFTITITSIKSEWTSWNDCQLDSCAAIAAQIIYKQCRSRSWSLDLSWSGVWCHRISGRKSTCTWRLFTGRWNTSVYYSLTITASFDWATSTWRIAK